jgi:hypothetical protein
MAKMEGKKQFRRLNYHFILFPPDLVLTIFIFLEVPTDIAVREFCTNSDFQHEIVVGKNNNS